MNLAPALKEWKKATEPYQKPDLRRSLWQIATSVLPYLALFYAMVRSLEVSYWLTLALAIPASGFMVRTFIIFHDCCHGSFFRTPAGNRLVGILTGLLTFTPYDQWRHSHAIHHATAGDLDRRGVGDVLTLTTEEYRALPPLKRLGYRLYRHPLIMFGLGPSFVFLVTHRFAHKNAGQRERASVRWTNVALLAIVTILSLLIGLKEYLLVQMPIMVIGGAAGVWLFYIQHNFEGVYWRRHAQWEFVAAGLQGSSYYRLPKLLQWFTGNIGFHHIHHLNPRIPNYFLETCQRSIPLFQNVKPLTLRDSLRSLSLRLWDEQQQRLVGFAEVRAGPK